MKEKALIQIENLVKNYDDTKVLKGLDLQIHKGDFFALLGYNGAGKSTTINILTNLVEKTSGKVYIKGIDIDEDFFKARELIGVVPQEFNFDIFAKVKDIPVLQAGYYGIARDEAIKRTQELLKKLELWDKRDKKAKELSGGMKRRLMIVRALVHKPEILILDEPTAGVDVELRQSMWEFIKELHEAGTTIVLTTHYLEEVEALCDTVAIMSEGKIIKQTSVDSLLESLDEEVLILELIGKDNTFSEKFTDKYKLQKIDSEKVEITIKKGMDLTTLFELLHLEDIKVRSVRNKQNRVEALFMKLLQK